MKGLELSEHYFEEVGIPMIRDKFSDYKDRIAAGLVGDGSECFGFDDDISRDHDWGPSFCLWLTLQDYEVIGKDLQAAVNELPGEFAGIKARNESAWGSGRTGVFVIEQFYKRFIGIDHFPSTLLEWRTIPEVNLAVATNGKIFIDPLGRFTTFRNKLKEYYPDDIRLKKIASRCMTIAQSGQYNYVRCIRRKEYVAAQCAETQFITDTIAMVFLLNKQYRPFYKWMHRALKNLPVLGNTVYERIFALVTAHREKDLSEEEMYRWKSLLIEEIAQFIIEELRMEGLSTVKSDFLLDHGPVIQNNIQDVQIKGLDVWVE